MTLRQVAHASFRICPIPCSPFITATFAFGMFGEARLKLLCSFYVCTPHCPPFPPRPLITAMCDSPHSQAVVLDKKRNVFVLFYRPSAEFCANGGGGAAYHDFDAELRSRSDEKSRAVWMDVDQNKTPCARY